MCSKETANYLKDHPVLRRKLNQKHNSNLKVVIRIGAGHFPFVFTDLLCCCWPSVCVWAQSSVTSGTGKKQQKEEGRWDQFYYFSCSVS